MTDDVTTLDVVVGGPAGRTISPDLWGVFLEDINFAPGRRPQRRPAAQR